MSTEISQFGKGISIAAGFDLGAKRPVDSRETVDTLEDRDAHVTGNRAYEGMTVYVKEEGITYQYIKNDKGELEWIEFIPPALTTNELDDILDDVFKDEVEVEDEIVEVNSIKVITEEQIDNIIGSVF